MVSQQSKTASILLYSAQQLFLISSILLFVASLIYAGESQASHLSFLVNGKSVHTKPNPNKEYNEKNYGFGLQYEVGKLTNKWIPFVTMSGFLDSNSQESYYAGGGYKRRMMISRKMNYLHMDIGLVGFLMTRKDYNKGNPFPGILPVLSMGTRDVSVNVTYIPKVDSRMAELVFFQLQVNTDTMK